MILRRTSRDYCFDCIKSQRYRERHEDYDSGCRASHQEPTWWYFIISSDQPNNFDVQDRVERLREGEEQATIEVDRIEVDLMEGEFIEGDVEKVMPKL
jgi:hypothetical protein